MQTCKKILYLMGIDWNWIYQRPQIIAKYLSCDYDVTAVYPICIWDWHNVNLCKNNTSDIHKQKLWLLPLQNKNRLVHAIAKRYWSYKLKKYQQYEYIYIGDPIYIECIPKDYNGCIIYDCIDNHVEMCQNNYKRMLIEHAEKALIQRSNIIIVSSQKLLKKINKQAPNKKIYLVRNGTAFDKIYDVKNADVKNKYNIGYFGTISEWFDYQLIEQSIQRNSELIYYLIGPHLMTNMSENDRIVYVGTVEHSQLHVNVKNYDCLVMPFVVNELVKAVDPVKLYEYIAFGKCIISVYYEELEHFKDYVYFYTTTKEYNTLMDEMIRAGFPPKYNEEQQQNFLHENNWIKRYQLIHNAIEQTNI